MSTPAVALILGAGKRIGASVAKKFSDEGYLVVVVSRSGAAEGSAKAIASDLSNETSVSSVFQEVREKYGEPQVVIYNAFGLTIAPAHNPFSLDPSVFAKDLAINTTSVYTAIYESLKSFETLGPDVHKPGTFIFTGNILGTGFILPPFFGLGTGKVATSYLISTAATVYGEKGYRFYYADERKATGGPKGENVDGNAHAELYLELARATEQKPWNATFVAGQGYTKF